jgi:hypothetical protein
MGIVTGASRWAHLDQLGPKKSFLKQARKDITCIPQEMCDAGVLDEAWRSRTVPGETCKVFTVATLTLSALTAMFAAAALPPRVLAWQTK